MIVLIVKLAELPNNFPCISHLLLYMLEESRTPYITVHAVQLFTCGSFTTAHASDCKRACSVGCIHACTLMCRV